MENQTLVVLDGSQVTSRVLYALKLLRQLSSDSTERSGLTPRLETLDIPVGSL
jgi:hypothetical protein